MIVAKIKKNVEGKKDLMNYFIIVVREKNKNREKSNKRSGYLQYNPPRSTCAGLAKRRCGGAENEISMKNHITYPVLRRRFCCGDLQVFLSPKDGVGKYATMHANIFTITRHLEWLNFKGDGNKLSTISFPKTHLFLLN